MLKSDFQCSTLLNIGEEQMYDLSLLKKIILVMHNNCSTTTPERWLEDELYFKFIYWNHDI